MRTDLRDKFNQLFLPHSRYVLVSLLAVNLVVGVYLVSREQAPQQITAPLPAIQPELRLVDAYVTVDEAASDEAVAQATVLKQAETVRECRVWGPEPSPEAFTELATKLRSSGGFPEIVSTKVRGRAEYLVYVDHLDSRDNAKRAAQELEALKIESYLMTQADKTPVVSVGVFSSQDRAQVHMQRVSELGYEVGIEAMSRSQTVYNMTAHVFPDTQAYSSSISTCAMIAQG